MLGMEQRPGWGVHVFSLLKSIEANFGHESGEILKNTKIRKYKKIDRISKK